MTMKAISRFRQNKNLFLTTFQLVIASLINKYKKDRTDDVMKTPSI